MIFVVVSCGHFDPLIRKCAELYPQYDFMAQIGDGQFVPPFPYIRTAPPETLEKHMREAELVIAHGGTGMLSMLYRLKKPTVVVPKQKLYGEPNDGQIELAAQWARLGMATLCLDLQELQMAIERCRETSFHYPGFSALGKYLRSVITD